MKHLILTVLSVVIFLVLTTFCRKYDSYPQPTYTIAMATDTPPYSYAEAGPDDTLVQKGIDYEALELIAAQQNFKYRIVADTWNNSYYALIAGKVDAFLSVVSATEDRKEIFDFYLYSEEELAVATLLTRTDITSLEDLRNKIVVVMPNTVSYQYAMSLKNEYNLSVIEISDYQQCYQSVINGTVDAIIEEETLLRVALRDYFPTIKISVKTGYTTPIGFAVQKGKNAPLLQMFGDGFQIIKENKRWKSIRDKYLGD